MISASETEASMAYSSWVHQRNFQSTLSASSNPFNATQVNPEMGLAEFPMVSGSSPEASQNVGFENRTTKIRRQQPSLKSSDHIASKALRPKQSKRKTSARKCSSPNFGNKNAVIIVNGTDVDFSAVPAPVCSCTGQRHQCYRWGAGGWQSSCCTTSISEYPLPVSSSRRGARIAGRKMSSGAYIKLLQRLAAEGHDLSNAVDLKNHWARHGTNKFVTISIISEADTSAMEIASWVHQRNFLSSVKASSDSPQATRVNPEIGLSSISMVASTQADSSQNGEFKNKITKNRSSQQFVKQSDHRMTSNASRPKQSKKTNYVPKMKKRKGNSQASMKHSDSKNDIFINERALDFSRLPAPVCSCTGMRRQCYRWGSGGWQSSCCTTSISEYPLPMSLSRPGARLAGRKMSNGAYGKLLQRLSAEGHDFSKPIDLKNHWARHGTNKFVTISIISKAETEESAMDFTGWVHQRNFQSATKAGPNSLQASKANTEVGIAHVPILPGLPGNVSQNGEPDQRFTKKSNHVASKVLRQKQSKKMKRKGSSNEVTKREQKNTGIIINGTTVDFSGAPAPVCSCTGVAHQCYRWGEGGWQSSCCTTSISEYPLPLIPSKSGARMAGRKMSNGAYVKLLQRLTAEGHDLSRAVDLKNHWARHGTNKFVTIRHAS